MLRRCVRNERSFIARRYAPALLLLWGFLVLAPPSRAQVTLGPVTLGGGMRTSYVHTEPDGANSTDNFNLDSARLYVNGNVTDKIKFMFNTEYDGSTNNYWGDFAKKIKVSVGAFDGKSADGNPDVIGAARVQIDFWDKEDGYYLNRTYYGDKNLLAIAGATQIQSGHTATTVDFLMEKKLPNAGAITIEGEYANYNRLGGYDANYSKSQGGYGLGSYLFPKQVGVGKFQILGKYAHAQFTHGIHASYNQKTTEVNFNYVMKQFNARAMTFFKDTRFNGQRKDFWQAGIGLQFQM